MLDENLPSYHLRKSPDDPLTTILYFTHHGSDLAPAYLLKRPAPASSHNQFALALFDAHNASVLYGEVLVRPQGTLTPSSSSPSPSTSTSPSSSSPTPTPPSGPASSSSSSPPTQAVPPDSFAVLLYNPDDSVPVRKTPAGIARPDFWAFSIPERTFKLPTPSALDREGPSPAALAMGPRIAFHWRRDSRLGRDMTCWMVGRGMMERDGRRGKEPDIPVAMYRAGPRRGAGAGGVVSIYEPNMARVEVEDGKGLEVVLLLSAVVVRELYLAPGQDVFNTAGGVAGEIRAGAGGGAQVNGGGVQGGAVNGGMRGQGVGVGVSVDEETRRLREMVAEEERAEAARRRREEEEETRRLLEGERELRRLRQAEVDRETERLRRQYGVHGSNHNHHNSIDNHHNRNGNSHNRNGNHSSNNNRLSVQGPSMSGALGASRHSVSGGRFFGPPTVGPALPVRPSSVAPVVSGAQQQQHVSPQLAQSNHYRNSLHPQLAQSNHHRNSLHPQHAQPSHHHGQKNERTPGLGLGLGKAPRATASVLDLFSLRKEDSEKKKLKKKQSVRF